VAITATISRSNWGDIVSNTTSNPVAEGEILRLARSAELLVEDEDNLFVPVEQPNGWTLEAVLSEDAVADVLRIPHHEARRLLIEADIPVFLTRERMFSAQKLWRATDIKEKLEALTAAQGLAPQEAALELGLTLASYQPLVKEVPYNSNNRVLKTLLEAYRNKFLPTDKIWRTRTSLLKEFIDSFNRANPRSTIVLQPCEVADCGHAASAQCTNPKCRDSGSSRFVCPAHEEWVAVKDMRLRPPALCPSCAAKVRDGKLPGFSLL
jgi:hypothetical protein